MVHRTHGRTACRRRHAAALGLRLDAATRASAVRFVPRRGPWARLAPRPVRGCPSNPTPKSILVAVEAVHAQARVLDSRVRSDWFAYTLIDHDAFINETMWQNAGLCGVDPYYRGLLWDCEPSQANDEFTASRDAGTPSAEERSGYVSSNQYTRLWLNLPPTELPPWPPALLVAAARSRPSIERVQKVAAARRTWLQEAFRFGGRVSRVGVRIPLPLVDEPESSHVEAALASQSVPAEEVTVGHMRFRVPPILSQEGRPGNGKKRKKRAPVKGALADHVHEKMKKKLKRDGER